MCVVAFCIRCLFCIIMLDLHDALLIELSFRNELERVVIESRQTFYGYLEVDAMEAAGFSERVESFASRIEDSISRFKARIYPLFDIPAGNFMLPLECASWRLCITDEWLSSLRGCGGHYSILVYVGRCIRQLRSAIACMRDFVLHCQLDMFIHPDFPTEVFVGWHYWDFVPVLHRFMDAVNTVCDRRKFISRYVDIDSDDFRRVRCRFFKSLLVEFIATDWNDLELRAYNGEYLDDVDPRMVISNVRPDLLGHVFASWY
jgi:hypothetical protein